MYFSYVSVQDASQLGRHERQTTGKGCIKIAVICIPVYDWMGIKRDGAQGDPFLTE